MKHGEIFILICSIQQFIADQYPLQKKNKSINKSFHQPVSLEMLFYRRGKFSRNKYLIFLVADTPEYFPYFQETTMTENVKTLKESILMLLWFKINTTCD